MNNLNIFDYTQLAEASYANLLDEQGSLHAESVILGDLQDEDRGGGFSATQAKELTDHWSVRAQYKDRTDESSFSATLFQKKVTDKDTGKDTGTGEYVFACKGTKELYVDGAEADIGDMVHDGLAIYQIVDMYNFWQQITAPKGESYKVRVLELDKDATALVNSEFNTESLASLQAQGCVIESNPVTGFRRVMRFVEKDASEIYTKPDDERKLGLGINPSKVTVTGHSLGGHLSAAFSRLFPNIVENSIMINGAGFADVGTSAIGHGNIQNVFEKLGGEDHFDADKIMNITGDKNINLVAQDWWPVGLQQPGSQSELFIEAANFDFNDTVFGHASSQLTDTMAVVDLFFRIDKSLAGRDFHELIPKLNEMFKASSNDEDQSLERIIQRLNMIYLNKPEALQTNDREALYASVQALQAKIHKSGDKTVEILSGKTEDQLVALAKSDIAYRYALSNFDPFAILGLDYSSFNLHGELDLQNWSDQYLQDLIQAYALVSSYNTSNETGTSYSPWSGDFTVHDAQFEDAEFNADGVGGDQIIFGSKGNDAELIGGSNSDRIYGGGGDDTLDGQGGNDYLEGGSGTDKYMLGAGVDTVFDSDGKGELHYAGERITGNFISTGGYYFSEDKKYRLIERNNQWILSAKSGERYVDIAQLNDWESGQFDISVASATPTDPDYIPTPSPNVNAFLNFNASRATKGVWIEGGLKSDSFTGSGHGDVIKTGDGLTHYVNAQGGNDRITGGAGRDFIIAGVNREVNSDPDDDTVFGGGGNDIIQGGGGHDILWADDESDTFQNHDDLKSVERGDWISGGYGDDFIYGSNAKDVLFGGAGGDNLYGGAGDDLLLGDAHYTSFSGTTSLSWAPGNTYSYVYKPEANGGKGGFANLRPTFLSCFSH